MKRLWITFALLLASPALAEDGPPEIWRAEPVDNTVYVMPRTPSAAEKAEALLRQAPIPRAVRPPPPVPVVAAAEKNELDEQADLNMDDLRKFSRKFVLKTDVCARHGMRKVTVKGGKSWRCK
jgi:hypothetical protein